MAFSEKLNFTGQYIYKKNLLTSEQCLHKFFFTLVTLVALFSFHFFPSCPSCHANVNKDYVIFLYFCNITAKIDQKTKKQKWEFKMADTHKNEIFKNRKFAKCFCDDFAMTVDWLTLESLFNHCGKTSQWLWKTFVITRANLKNNNNPNCTSKSKHLV